MLLGLGQLLAIGCKYTSEVMMKYLFIFYRELKQNTFCKTTVRKQRNDKNLDTRWTSFVNNPGAGHLVSLTQSHNHLLASVSRTLTTSLIIHTHIPPHTSHIPHKLTPHPSQIHTHPFTPRPFTSRDLDLSHHIKVALQQILV